MALTSPAERAAQRVARFGQRHADALQLGRLASAAVRVESHLLRRLRRELLPDVDVGAEADLWFSPLMESRGAAAVVFDASVAELLRDDLGQRAGDRRTLVRALEITADAHRGAPDTIQLEERIVALALLEGDAARGAIDEALRPALRTMRGGDDEARAVAQWALRALPRLPAVARAADNVLALGLAAAALLGRRRILKQTPERPIEAANVSWALPAAALAKPARVGVQLLDRGILFSAGAPDVPSLDVPDTDPPFVIIGWQRAGQRIESLVAAEPGRSVDLEADVDEVMVSTLAGDEYRLFRAAVETEFPYDVYLAFAAADRAWAEKLQLLLAQQGLKAFLDPIELKLPDQTDALDVYLETARHFVVLWSRRARTSPRVASVVQAFETAPSEDPPRQLVVLNLQGRDSSLSDRHRRIDDSDLAYGYERGPEAISPEAWKRVTDKIVAALRGTTVDLSQFAAIAQACVRVDTLGSQTIGYTGVRTEGGVIVTAAEPFRGTPILAVDVPDPSGSGFLDGGQAEVLNPRDDRGFLLLRPIPSEGAAPLPAKDPPSDTSTDWLQSGRAEGTEAAVIGVDGLLLRTVIGRITGQTSALGFTVRLPGGDVPPTFLGAAVVVESRLRGIVTAIRESGGDAHLDVVAIVHILEERRRRAPEKQPPAQQSTAPGPTYRAAKLVVVGPPSSGRTALIRAMVGDSFEERERVTLWRIEAPPTAPDMHALVVISKAEVGESAWSGDWPLPLSLEGADAVLLVVEADDRQWERVPMWMEIIRRGAAPSASVLLVGTLGDKHDATDVNPTNRKLESMVSEVGAAGAVVTSAKTGANIGKLREMVLAAIERTGYTLDADDLAAIPRVFIRDFVAPEAGRSALLQVGASLFGGRMLTVDGEQVAVSADTYGQAVTAIVRRTRMGPLRIPAGLVSELVIGGRRRRSSPDPDRLREEALARAVIADLQRVGLASTVEGDRGQVLVIPTLLPLADMPRSLELPGHPLLLATWPGTAGPAYALVLGQLAYWRRSELKQASLDTARAEIGKASFWIRARDEAGSARLELFAEPGMGRETREVLDAAFRGWVTAAQGEAAPTFVERAERRKATVYIGYSDSDREYLEELRTHLRALEEQNPDIEFWDHARVEPRESWGLEVRRAIQSTAIAVLLISATYLESEFRQREELPALLDVATRHGARVLLLLVSPSKYEKVESLSRHQTVNRGKTLREMQPAQRERVYARLTATIASLLRESAPRSQA